MAAMSAPNFESSGHSTFQSSSTHVHGTSAHQSAPVGQPLFPQLPTAQTSVQLPTAQSIPTQISGSTLPLSAEELRVKLISEEKYLEDRITHVERHFSSLASGLGGVVRKTAHLRNKGDNIVKTLHEFANNESGGVKTSLMAVADCFSALEDYSDAKIEKLESRVVRPLVEYGNNCRKARDEVRMIHVSGEKEVHRRKALERVKISHPTNRKKISESELQKAKIDRMRTAKSVEDYMMEFERRRTIDLKAILLEYIHAQLVYHARAMELFTAAYQKTLSIQEQEVTDKYLLHLAPRRIHAQPGQSRSGSPTGSHAAGSSTPLSSTTPIHSIFQSTPPHSIPTTPAHTARYATPTLSTPQQP